MPEAAPPDPEPPPAAPAARPVRGLAWTARLGTPGRIAVAVGRDVADGPLPLHASSLVYTTLLSLVPLLALAFSVLKGLGVHNQLADLLTQWLAPLGPMADDIAQRVIAFVDNVHVGVLGAVGLVFLLYTSISVGRKVEMAANQIWHVTRARTIGQSIAGYLTVVVAGPILLFSALALTASMMSSAAVQSLAGYKPLGWLVEMLASALPYGFVLVGYSLVYWLVPNTRVRPQAALAGGAVAALCWMIAGLAFARFVAGSTSYTAIYSAFAGLILFLIWLYVNWLILLAGCAVAFYVQFPRAASVRPDAAGDAGRAERVGFQVMQAVGAAAYRGEPAPDQAAIERRLGLPPDPVNAALDRLQAAGLIARSDDRPARYYPARPLEMTPLKAVWDAVRAATPAAAADRVTPEVAACVAGIDDAVTAALARWTIRDLVLASAGLPAARAGDPGAGGPAAGDPAAGGGTAGEEGDGGRSG
jgi:membrane protein